MNTFEAYQNKAFDLTAFGLMRAGTDYACFCTPVGAEIFAAPGVDGNHYCRIVGFGETIFAVSPANGAGEYVHPVARSFEDFLRLLLMLDGEAAIEQCWQWSQEQFDAFMADERVSQETKEAAYALMEQTGLEPMERPYDYIRSLQASFDYKSLPFSDEYYETVPPEDLTEQAETHCEQPASDWAVYYEDSFGVEQREGDLCREISVGKRFSWAGREWCIPSVYICGQGMVTDILMRVDRTALRAFLEKWQAIKAEGDLTDAQCSQVERENPLAFDFTAALTAGGQELRTSGGCAIPLVSWEEEFDRWDILKHYDLNPADGWLIQRTSFPWPEGHALDLSGLTVAIAHQPGWIPGEAFTAAAGESLTFTNPVTGVKHTLTVQALEEQTHTFDQTQRIQMGLPELEYPDRFRTITYTVTPEPEEGSFRITDFSRGDSPREKGGKACGATAIGIIFGHSREDEGDFVAAAASSLYFTLPEQTTWQISFRERQYDEIKVSLLKQ